jgi:hypothetical protein
MRCGMKKLIKQQFSNEIEKKLLNRFEVKFDWEYRCSKLKNKIFWNIWKILWEQLRWKLRDDLKRQLNENTN